jgi:hypothetical protein
MTFSDAFIPPVSKFTLFLELKLIVRVQGAKSNVFHSTVNYVIEFKPNQELVNLDFEEALKALRL